MYAVAKKSKPVADPTARQIPPPRLVIANTQEWRLRVNETLNARGRGARADLVRHLKERYPTFSSGQLSDILGTDEVPGQKRYSQYVRDIDEWLWGKPKLMPLSPDAHEMRHLLERLVEADKDLLSELLDMDANEQKALAAFIKATRKPK